MDKGKRNLHGMTARRPNRDDGTFLLTWVRAALPFSVEWKYAVRLPCGCIICGQTVCDPEKSRDSAAEVLREGHRKLCELVHDRFYQKYAELGEGVVVPMSANTVH